MPTLLLDQAIKISMQLIAAFTYDMKLNFKKQQPLYWKSTGNGFIHSADIGISCINQGSLTNWTKIKEEFEPSTRTWCLLSEI